MIEGIMPIVITNYVHRIKRIAWCRVQQDISLRCRYENKIFAVITVLLFESHFGLLAERKSAATTVSYKENVLKLLQKFL